MRYARVITERGTTMEQHERRAAFSAFIWTIVLMSLLGGVVLWQSNAIHAIPSTQPTADTSDVTQYQKALDDANNRLTEASQRITTLEQQVAQAESSSTNSSSRSSSTTGI
jgi:septal ring factor EnvC (AmiA/AmiB activator)